MTEKEKMLAGETLRELFGRATDAYIEPRDIPANCVAAGNPCRVIRELDASSLRCAASARPPGTLDL